MTSRSKEPVAAPAAPRFALGWAAAFYALCALALAYPALGGQFLVSGISDQYIGGYAVREFAASSLKAGHGFPLWNPYLFGGMPYVASMGVGDVFYPTFLLRWLMPVDAAMTWSFIIHLFLAGLFTFLFLRAWGLGFLPSLVGGAAYMMAGPIAGYAAPGHDGKLYIGALHPVSFFLLVRGIRDGRRWTWGVLAIVMGLAVLSPHPQLLQYMLLSYGAFALYLSFADTGAGALDRRTGAARFALSMGAVVLGGMIGAIQYSSVPGYVTWSPRAQGMAGGYEHATSYSMPPEELINSYLPQFSGILEHYWGRNAIHFHSDYLGVVVLLLAALAFGRSSERGRRSFVWFWAGTLIVALLWALGGFTPFYRLIYAIVPGTKFFRAPSTMMYQISLALAVLAAVGVERALSRDVSNRYLIAWGAGAGVALALAASGALTNLGDSLIQGWPYQSGQLEYMSQLNRENLGPMTAGALRSLAFILAGAATLWLLRERRIGVAAAGWALAGLVAADLWTVEHNYWRFSEPASKLYASDPAIEYMRSHEQPARVLAIEVPGQLEQPRDVFLKYDGLMIHKLRLALGYHGNQLRRYDELLGGESHGYSNATNPNVWRLLNVRYLYTNGGGLDIPGGKQILGPVKNATGNQVYLYRLPGDNPAAWVSTVAVKAPDESSLATITDARFDPRSAAIFDTSAAVPAAIGISAQPAPSTLGAQVTRYDPGHITVRLAGPAPAGAALVVSENYYPGWEATVGGKAAPIGRADYTLMGVVLPAGATEVDLRFASHAYEVGKLITLVALALAAAVATVGATADRRARG